jgi:DNA-binding NarL/FixJ family response regulator
MTSKAILHNLTQSRICDLWFSTLTSLNMTLVGSVGGSKQIFKNKIFKKWLSLHCRNVNNNIITIIHLVDTMTTKIITIIDENSFLRECIKRSLQSVFPFRILTYSDINDFRLNKGRQKSSIIIFSLCIIKEYDVDLLNELSEIQPNTSIIVLGPRADFISAVIHPGVRGYIPVTMNFEVVVEAVRVVLAGGTYIPMDCLHAPASDGQINKSSVALTSRELSVVRAIQLGKPNKIIAYHLGMTENTVKVHVRHIMSKLKAKNRTEIAIISEKYFSISS